MRSAECAKCDTRKKIKPKVTEGMNLIFWLEVDLIGPNSVKSFF